MEQAKNGSIDSIISETEGRAGRAFDQASDAVKKIGVAAKEEAGSLYNKASAATRDMANSVSDTACEQMKSVQDFSTDKVNHVEKWVQERPFTAIAVAGLAGYLLAGLCRRSA